MPDASQAATPTAAPKVPDVLTPREIDISHHNVGPLKGGGIDFEAAAGIRVVICKASEGADYGDPTYDAR
jgi:hypothetical protein